MSLTVVFFAASFAGAEDKPGSLSGLVISMDSNGARAVIPEAALVIESAKLSRKTTADERGQFSFADLPAGQYQIRAGAAGLVGSASTEVKTGKSVDVLVVMEIEAIKESVTVNGNVERAITAEPEQRTEIDRSTVVSTPNKDDRADSLLPSYRAWFEGRTAS